VVGVTVTLDVEVAVTAEYGHVEHVARALLPHEVLPLGRQAGVLKREVELLLNRADLEQVIDFLRVQQTLKAG